MRKKPSSHAFGFAAVILFSVVLWQSVFSAVSAPKKQESLQLFVTASQCSTQRIRERLEDLPVKQVAVRWQSSTAGHYQEQLMTLGILNSDLLILDSSIFAAEYAWQEFAPLDGQLLARYGLDPERYQYVSQNGQNYAVVIHDADRGISLLESCLTVCDPGKQYCIAVNVNMPNAAPFSSGENTTDHAFRALALLLQEADV